MGSVMSYDSLSFLKYRFVEFRSLSMYFRSYGVVFYIIGVSSIVLVFDDIVSFSFSTKITKLKVMEPFSDRFHPSNYQFFYEQQWLAIALHRIRGFQEFFMLSIPFLRK